MIAVCALVVARFINWAIYNWAYHRQPIGPWSPAPGGGKRSPADHLPIIGWWLLRRESGDHGKWFWFRPLCIELLFPMAIGAYYVFYTEGGTLPRGVMALPFQIPLHWQFLAHFLLAALMTIATFIDFDEQSIPDHVTIPGTCMGLCGALFAPAWFPFDTLAGISELHAASPGGWPAWMDGTAGLKWAVLIAVAWGFALLDRRWITRRGWKKAVAYFFARMARSRDIWMAAGVGVAVLLGLIAYGWTAANPGRWTYLLSGLFGLAFAGGMTWGVRISASIGLGVEALGFGDVTLMAMIGAFLGWQPSMLVFFLAPLVAILFVLLRWMITGDTATPYGPYLCAATVLVLVFWDALWTNWAAPVFASLGSAVVGIAIACVALMGIMLWIWRLIKEAVL